MNIADIAGCWPFIDEAVNVRNPSAAVTTVNTSFVPAFAGSDINVVEFRGDSYSYVIMKSTGDLAVSSFTLSADIFPESDVGTLFQWHSSIYEGYGTRVLLRRCALFVRMRYFTETAKGHSDIILNTWNKVAVSYDSPTGVIETYVNGVVRKFFTGQIGSEDTSGFISVGARDHVSTNLEDVIGYRGKMACVQLWSMYRALSSVRDGVLECYGK